MAKKLNREQRDWALFVDWCASWDLPALPTRPESIARFLEAFPAPLDRQTRRVRAIRRAHEASGEELDLPTEDRRVALREGDGWVDVPRALAQVVKHAHLKYAHQAVRGRRDAWLLVLVGVLRFTREEARSIEPDDIRLYPRITVRGRRVPKSDLAQECPACATTRWLRVAADATLGRRITAAGIVSPTGVDELAHDCAVGLDGEWRFAPTLLPAIDQHGWLTQSALSIRAITSTMALRQRPGALASGVQRFVPRAATGRFADASLAEVYDEFGDVDRRSTELLLRMADLLGETEAALDHLSDLKLGRARA